MENEFSSVDLGCCDQIKTGNLSFEHCYNNYESNTMRQSNYEAVLEPNHLTTITPGDSQIFTIATSMLTENQTFLSTKCKYSLWRNIKGQHWNGLNKMALPMIP